MRPEFLLFLGGYFALLVFFGLKFARRVRNLEDFFLASRALPAALILFSLTASWFGATSILVTSDEAFRVGLSAFWLVGMPAVAAVLIFALFLSRPIRSLPILTLPDLVELRYGKSVRHLASALIFWYMVVLAASQMVAAGNFLRPFLGIAYFWCLVLTTVIVLIYLISGGLFSVVITDIFQCLLLGGGIVGLALFLVKSSSLEAVLQASGAAGKDGLLNFFFDWKRNALIALSFTLAWTISPIAWQRVQAARTAGKARQGFLLAAMAFIFLYGLVVLIGIFSIPLFSAGEPASPLLAEFIARKAGLVGGGFLFLAVIAAVLSTMDTAINTGALTLARDIYQQAVPPRPEDGRSVLAGRASTLLVAILSFAVATRFQSILQTIGLASEIMAEGLFVPGMAMFFFKKKRPWAGALGLGLGGGFALAGFFSEMKVLPLSLPEWPFSLPYGLGLSLIGFAAGFWIEKLRSRRV